MKSRRPIHAPDPYAATLAPLRVGADPGVEDKYGNTGLHSVVIEDCLSTVVLHLLAAGVDPNSKNNDGDTPVHLAAERLRVDTLRCLLAAGGDPNAQGVNGNTALHWASAIARNSVPVVELLLTAGADATVRNNPGMSALDEARKYQYWRGPSSRVARKMLALLAGAGRRHDASGPQ